MIWRCKQQVNTPCKNNKNILFSRLHYTSRDGQKVLTCMWKITHISRIFQETDTKILKLTFHKACIVFSLFYRMTPSKIHIFLKFIITSSTVLFLGYTIADSAMVSDHLPYIKRNMYYKWLKSHYITIRLWNTVTADHLTHCGLLSCLISTKPSFKPMLACLQVHPGCHYWGCNPGVLSSKPSHCNSFDIGHL